MHLLGAILKPPPLVVVVYLDGFWIDKTPTTNKEYKRFIDANPKHKVPHRTEDWAKPFVWDKHLRTYQRDKVNHPVVLVSWYDAKAYADWASLQLPTEQQWEKAARGIDGRLYPWGPEWQEGCCNTKVDGMIERTSPVGQFSPQGDSPYGCVDMSGNVWDWTDSLYEEGLSARVLRGGSWVSKDRIYARTDYRYWLMLDMSSGNVGFRLVLPSNLATN